MQHEAYVVCEYMRRKGKNSLIYIRNMFVTNASPLQQLTKYQTNAIRDIGLEREEQTETRHLKEYLKNAASHRTSYHTVTIHTRTQNIFNLTVM
jgi:hypothetical protein